MDEEAVGSFILILGSLFSSGPFQFILVQLVLGMYQKIVCPGVKTHTSFLCGLGNDILYYNANVIR
jgi:hypothetical protein